MRKSSSVVVAATFSVSASVSVLSVEGVAFVWSLTVSLSFAAEGVVVAESLSVLLVVASTFVSTTGAGAGGGGGDESWMDGKW